MENSALVQVDQISKTYGTNNDAAQVLRDISFSIKRSEIISILGESGCGKSTLLNIIGGFEQPSKGKVILNGQVVDKPSRNCVMLFQNYGLLPWRSVYKNVELGLESLNLSAKERRERAEKYLKLVGLENTGNQLPHQLSGGMQQRVAIARALVTEPEMILMDEPFAALDTFNRYYLQDELINIQRESKTTIVLVTHDIDEAVFLSDRIFIMGKNPGEIHHTVHLDISKPRDRSSGDFQYYRKLIFEKFELSRTKNEIEYYI